MKPGEVFIVPVRLDECRVPDMDIDSVRSLARLQYVDVFDTDSSDDGIKDLVEALEGQIKDLIEQKSDYSEYDQEDLEVEMSIDRKFDEFDALQQKSFLKAIQHILEVGSVKLVRKRRGSVKLTIELSPGKAELLRDLLRAGVLKEYGITEVNAMFEYSDSQPDPKLDFVHLNANREVMVG